MPLIYEGKMTQAIPTNNSLMRYLLGRMPDEEQQGLEEVFFDDAAAFDELLIAENELIDAYVGGRLTPADRRSFEQRLLLTQRQHGRSRFAAALQEYMSTSAALDPASVRSHWLSSLIAPFSFQTAVMGVAAVILVAVAGGWWLYRQPRVEQTIARVDDTAVTEQPPAVAAQRSPMLDEPATAPSKATVASGEPRNAKPNRAEVRPVPVIASIVLPLGKTRDMAAGKPFSVPESASGLRIEAPLDDAKRGVRYFAVLETVDGQQIWRGKASFSKSGSIDALVPRHRLKDGDYILTVKQLNARGMYESAGDYSFRINGRK